MAFELGSVAVAAGFRLASYETIGSTSSEAAQRFRDGDPGALWVASKAQTAGHGRRGRHWETPPDNLAASLLLPIQASPAVAATLGFAAGLALEEAIRNAAPSRARPPRVTAALDGARGADGGGDGFDLRLKWPNDLLAGGAKVAGILLETVGGPGGSQGVVIGLGVNVVHAPAGLPYPVTSLAEVGPGPNAEALFAALSDCWVRQQELWDDGNGFAAIRRLWLQRAAGLGAPVAVHAGDGVTRGVFETIDEDGMLVVRRPDGSARRIAAGEVHFGAAATMRQ